MKEQDCKLTLQEIEQLCHLYMECNLSVFEETELRYLLTQVDYHSPLIDDVRRIMNIEANIADRRVIKAVGFKKHLFSKGLLPISIAASVAVIIGIGLTLFHTPSTETFESQPYYIAYVDGQRLSEDAARSQIEAEKKSVDDFIKEMSEHEAQEQQTIDNFFNL